jgi:hypothetical protein
MSYGTYGNRTAGAPRAFDNNRSYDNGGVRGYASPDRRPAQRFEQPDTRFEALQNFRPEPPKPVDPKSRDLMRFKDNYYAVELLHAQSNIGPKIEVTSDELHDNFITLVVPSRELPEVTLAHEPVFTKYEGKYVVLLGLKAVMAWAKSGNGKLKGRLLSSVALKRCLVE